MEPALSWLLQGCSLRFACTSLAAASTKLLAVSVPALQPALCLHIALSCYGIRACHLPGFKPLKPLKPAVCQASTPKTLRGSFHQAWPSAFCCSSNPLQGCCSFLAVSVPALQPALCLHSLLLLGHSSLPFARLQNPKTLRGSFHQAWPSAFAAPGLLLFPGRQRSSIAACPLPAQPSLVRAFADGQERAATLEQQRLTARLGGSCRREVFGVLKPGKRQVRIALTREGCAGKGQAAMLERSERPGKEQQPWSSKGWRPRLGGRCRRGFLGFWSLANGRLECPNKRRLCRQKGRLQCWNADGQKEQQAWSSKGWRPGLVEACRGGF